MLVFSSALHHPHDQDYQSSHRQQQAVRQGGFSSVGSQRTMPRKSAGRSEKANPESPLPPPPFLQEETAALLVRSGSDRLQGIDRHREEHTGCHAPPRRFGDSWRPASPFSSGEPSPRLPGRRRFLGGDEEGKPRPLERHDEHDLLVPRRKVDKILSSSSRRRGRRTTSIREQPRVLREGCRPSPSAARARRGGGSSSPGGDSAGSSGSEAPRPRTQTQTKRSRDHPLFVPRRIGRSVSYGGTRPCMTEARADGPVLRPYRQLSAEDLCIGEEVPEEDTEETSDGEDGDDGAMGCVAASATASGGCGEQPSRPQQQQPRRHNEDRPTLWSPITETESDRGDSRGPPHTPPHPVHSNNNNTGNEHDERQQTMCPGSPGVRSAPRPVTTSVTASGTCEPRNRPSIGKSKSFPPRRFLAALPVWRLSMENFSPDSDADGDGASSRSSTTTNRKEKILQTIQAANEVVKSHPKL